MNLEIFASHIGEIFNHAPDGTTFILSPYENLKIEVRIEKNNSNWEKIWDQVYINNEWQGNRYGGAAKFARLVEQYLQQEGLPHTLVCPSAGQELKTKIRTTKNMILINAEGYGDADSDAGKGEPIGVEYYKGDLRVLLWENINNYEPNVYSMKDALESNRREG